MNVIPAPDVASVQRWEFAPPPASTRVRNRLKAAGASYHANSNIAAYLEPGDLQEMQGEAQAAIEALLRALVIDTDNDHNSRDTARRVAKMYCQEVYAGRYREAPALTDFPNASGMDELYTVGPIAVRSACSHHMVPIMGQAWIGVIPGERVVGLSKFARMAEWIMTRPQIQEEAVMMLADQLEEAIVPKGLAIVVRARHLCCGWRGVKDDAQQMTTSVMRGAFRTDETARSEFLSLIRGQGH
jgi:GTP cyclohydrolase I